MGVKVVAGIAAGSVAYSQGDAEIAIDEFIAQLEAVKKAGATHVVGLSQNYRGAQYILLGEPTLDF